MSEENTTQAQEIHVQELGIRDMEKLINEGKLTALTAFDEVERRIVNREKAGKKQIPHVIQFRNELGKKVGAVADRTVPNYTINDRIDTAFPSTPEEVAERVVAMKMDPAAVIAALTKIVAGL